MANDALGWPAAAGKAGPPALSQILYRLSASVLFHAVNGNSMHCVGGADQFGCASNVAPHAFGVLDVKLL